MTTSSLTRRDFIKASGVLTASGLILLASNSDSETPVAVGTIHQIELPRMQNITSRELTSSRNLIEKTITVVFSNNATFSRGGVLVNGLADFMLGDRVVAEGTWEESSFLANFLISLYDYFEGSVLDIQDDRLVTTSGTFLLTPRTESSLIGIKNGDYIQGQAWADPSSPHPIAMKFSQR